MIADPIESGMPEPGIQATAQGGPPSLDARASGEPAVKTAVGLSREEIKGLIDNSLERKLAPITDMLADSLEREPTVGDVIGGVGYIFGLAGVALYFGNRRKKG